jgi:hypothetical protein
MPEQERFKAFTAWELQALQRGLAGEEPLARAPESVQAFAALREEIQLELDVREQSRRTWDMNATRAEDDAGKEGN